MAGGIGSRFWPMSSPEMPKQFIDVLGCGRTLIQLTVDRFKDVCLPENFWVVTSAKYAEIVKEQLPEVPVDHILLEPCRRNTAPCIAYVSWKIKVRNPKANIVVTPSDHVVMNVREFARVVTSAMKFTADSDAIVTLGMKANRAETGYGYIEADLSMACPSNKEIYRVDAFREKPDLATAERYLQRNNYFWNAGIFVWNVKSKPFPGCWCCFPACWLPVSRPLRGPSPLWASRCPIWSSSCSAAQGRWWCCPGAAWAGRPSACCATSSPAVCLPPPSFRSAP